MRLCRQNIACSDAVEDLVQEVFISVWEGKRTFSDIKELTNYLYRACYNNTLLYIRNNQIHDTILSSLAEEEDVEDEDVIYALTVKRRNYPAALLLYRRTSGRTTPDHFNENRRTYMGRDSRTFGNKYQYC